jgi:ferredoxin like protein
MPDKEGQGQPDRRPGATSERFPGVEWVRPPGAFIEVDESKCDACARCVKVCLAGCFEISEKKARVASLDECMECAACWFACERDAITFSWPPGGTGYRSSWG